MANIHDQQKNEEEHPRRKARLLKVTAGLKDLDQRLRDLMLHGLSSIPKLDQYWDQMGARLIDAQIPTLAKRVRDFKLSVFQPEDVLFEVAQLHLICRGWQQRDILSDQELSDLKAVLGFPLSETELLSQNQVQDLWVVLHQSKECETHFSVLKHWFYGLNTHELRLIISYAAYDRGHPYTFAVGQWIEAVLGSYPGTSQQASLLSFQLIQKTPVRLHQLEQQYKGFQGVQFEQLLSRHAHFLSVSPWQHSRTYVVNHVGLSQQNGQWYAFLGFNENNEVEWLPLTISEDSVWKVLALSGGQPADYLVEWNGRTAKLLSYLHHLDTLISL